VIFLLFNPFTLSAETQYIWKSHAGCVGFIAGVLNLKYNSFKFALIVSCVLKIYLTGMWRALLYSV